MWLLKFRTIRLCEKNERNSQIGQRQLLNFIMEQAIHSRFDTPVMVASLGLISNISSSQTRHQIITGENSRTKPCRPAMPSTLTGNTTELTLPDGLCVGFVTLNQQPVDAGTYFGTRECLKNAFDSCAMPGIDRRVRHSDVWKLTGDTCLPLSVWLWFLRWLITSARDAYQMFIVLRNL